MGEQRLVWLEVLSPTAARWTKADPAEVLAEMPTEALLKEAARRVEPELPRLAKDLRIAAGVVLEPPQ
jgi:hypothetical protein